MGERERRDEGGGGGDDAGGAERGDAAARAVALQPRPRRAQDAHPAGLLLPRALAARRGGGVLRAGEAAGGAGEGAGAILPAGGAAGGGARWPARDRLQRRGCALRRRQGRLHRRRDVHRLRALPRGPPPPRPLRRLRRAPLRPRHGPGDVPELWRRGRRHGHAPRDDGRRGRVPVHQNVDGAVAWARRHGRVAVAAVARPHPPPGALAASRLVRAPGVLPELPQRAAAAVRDPRLLRPAQAPRRHQGRLRARRVHLRRGDCAPVARHVRRPGAPPRHRVAAARPGQHPAAAPPTAPVALLRQRHRARPRHSARPRHPVAVAGVRGGADQARGGARGRRVRAVGDRLPGAGVREGEPGGARAVHAGNGPVGGELARDAHLRRRLRVGAPQVRGAGADVRQRHGVRDAGAGRGRRQRRRRVRAVRARAGVPPVLREGLLRHRVI